MTPAVSCIQTSSASNGVGVKAHIDREVDALISSLPDAELLSAEQRRSIIARYTAVLEGNFIYWMTAAYLAAKSESAHEIILANLAEEVRDCHPGMLRRFESAAGDMPTETDAAAVSTEHANVRLFMGRLAGVPIHVT